MFVLMTGIGTGCCFFVGDHRETDNMSRLTYVIGAGVVLVAFLVWLWRYVTDADDMKRQNIVVLGVGIWCLMMVVAVYCGTITATLLAMTLLRANPHA
jgi:hypothetical protein